MKGCTLCGGTGLFLVEGKGRGQFANENYSAVRECICKRMGAPVVHEDGCNRCQGHGIYGGLIGTQYDGPWKWCDCAAGRERQQREPNLITETNVAREKCIRMDRKRSGKGLQPISALLGGIESYHGDF